MYICVYMNMSAQSCPSLCNPLDCNLPGFSVHGISQARILEWVAISFSRDLPDPGIKPTSLVSLYLPVDSFLLPHMFNRSQADSNRSAYSQEEYSDQ